MSECHWTYDDYHCYWEGACGAAWCVGEEGTLADHDVNFCPKCGGRVKDVTRYCQRCKSVLGLCDDGEICGVCEDNLEDEKELASGRQ